MKTLYSYDAAAKRAKVYHRTTGAVVCEAHGVDVYIGNLLDRLANEMYQQGYEAGRNAALSSVVEHVNSLVRL